LAWWYCTGYYKWPDLYFGRNLDVGHLEGQQVTPPDSSLSSPAKLNEMLVLLRITSSVAGLVFLRLGATVPDQKYF